jgi:NAD(P)-dependent dehydrogenase (short-subunit alcohol dehydrogenase family)
VSGRLAGKTAIVTGAGQGIGAAIARRFALEGARVVVAEVRAAAGSEVAAAITAAGGEAIAVPADVADPGSVQVMAERAAEVFGPPAILVNNAGIAVFSDPLKLSGADWRRCFDVDLDGVWHCCRAVLPAMLAGGAGSIVNIASVHSFEIIKGCFPYPVAKHGVVGLTRALAVEYAGSGIRVNAICPGYIDTPVNPPDVLDRAAPLVPLGRVGTADEVAWPAVFLASDEASFITGASLVVDGGRAVVYHD